MMLWPQFLVTHYQNKFFPQFTLNRAWMEIPSSITTGLVDTVRTRVLTFVLEIQSELPDEASDDIKSIPPAVVDRIVNVTILGGNNVIGSVEQFSTQTITAGDLPSLKAALEGLGLGEENVAELQTAIAEDGKSDTVGKKTLAWVAKNAKAGGKAGLKIGGEVAKEALTAYVKQFMGLGG